MGGVHLFDPFTLPAPSFTGVRVTLTWPDVPVRVRVRGGQSTLQRQIPSASIRVLIDIQQKPVDLGSGHTTAGDAGMAGELPELRFQVFAADSRSHFFSIPALISMARIRA